MTPLNDNADRDYLDDAQAQQDLKSAQNFISQYAHTPSAQRDGLLDDAGLSPDDFQTLLKETQSRLGERSEQAGRRVGGLETATKVAETGQSVLNLAGTAVLLPGGVGIGGIAARLVGAAAFNKAQEIAGDFSRRAFRKLAGPEHPIGEYAAQLVGGVMAGGAMLASVRGPSLTGAAASAPEAAASAEEGAARTTASAEPAAARETLAEPNPVAEGAGEPKTIPGAESAQEAAQPESQASTGTEQGAATVPENLILSPADRKEALRAHKMVAMVQEARARPMTAEEVAALKFKGEGEHATLENPIDAQDLLRLTFHSADRLDRTIEMARVARDFGDPEAANLYRDSSEDLLKNVIPRWSAALHESGLGQRTLQETESVAMRDAVSAIRAAGDDPTRLLKAVADIPTVEERRALMESVAQSGGRWRLPGALYNLWVNTLLSFNSVAVKATSDAASIIMQVPARAIAAGASRLAEVATGAPHGIIGVPSGEATAFAKGLMNAFGASIKVAAHAITTGERSLGSGVGFYDQAAHAEGLGQTSDALTQAVDYLSKLTGKYGPARGILGVDQFSKSMLFRANYEALARRRAFSDASQEGVAGAALARRTNELQEQYLAQRPDWLIRASMDAADEGTFTAPLEGLLKSVSDLRQKSYLLRAMVPFYHTLTNISLQTIRQSPLAVVSPKAWQTLADGGPEAFIQGAKIGLGTLLMGLGTHWALEGRITGGVPRNLSPELKQIWLKQHLPYSIKVGDQQRSFQRIGEPFAGMLAMAADMAPALPYLKDGQAERAAAILGAEAARELDRNPLWGSFHQLMQIFEQTEKGKGPPTALRLATRELSGFVPGPVRLFAGGEDPVRRQVNSQLDEIRNQIPYLKENGVPTLDPWGEPDIVPPGFMWNEFPAFKAATGGADPMLDEMIRLHDTVGFQPPEIPRVLGGRRETEDPFAPTELVYGAELTPEQRNRWMELRNPDGALKSQVRALMESPQYEEATDQVKANAIHEVFLAYQKQAEARLLAEDESLTDRVRAAYRRKAASRTTVTPAAVEAR